MNIIEKSIAETRGEQVHAGDAVSQGRALQLGSGYQLADSSGQPQSQHRVPRESINLRFEKLRAEGMMASDEFSDVMKDQFRRIKWPLLAFVAFGQGSAPTSPANRILVTSAIPGEGKTFVSLNLALSIAREKDYVVMLIDADAAKRHVTRLLGLEERRGLTDVIRDSSLDPEDAVLGTDVPGLTVMPAGGSTDSAPELFASDRMIQALGRLAANDVKRILLFDASPLLATNEPQVLSRIADQIVLVVRAESTPQPTVLEAVRLLDPSKEIRCVLNQAPLSKRAEYYYGETALRHSDARQHGR